MINNDPIESGSQVIIWNNMIKQYELYDLDIIDYSLEKLVNQNGYIYDSQEYLGYDPESGTMIVCISVLSKRNLEKYNFFFSIDGITQNITSIDANAKENIRFLKDLWVRKES